MIILLSIAAACTPRLEGTCAADADCAASEFCSGGMCLRRANSVDVLSPAAGALLPGHFHVSASVNTPVPVTDVTFFVINSGTGAVLGQAVVTAPEANLYSADLTLDSKAFGGAAAVRAVLHRAGEGDLSSTSVAITVDQNPPSIASSWDGSAWFSRDSTISLTATVADDRSGVGSAALLLPDGSSFSGVLSGAAAAFDVPGAGVVPAGVAAAVPFTLAVTDLAGNREETGPISTLHVDGAPPAVALTPLSASAWFRGLLDVNATIDDGDGSGMASARVLLDGVPVASQPPPSGSGWAFQPDLAALIPGTDGPVTVRVEGVDAVGNVGAAEQVINVDTLPPAVSAPRVETAPDLIDAFGRGWFRGPTLAPGAADIVVSAAIADQHLVNAGAAAPAAVVAGARYPGTFAAGRWTFTIPRSAGLNAGGAVPVVFDAEDVAGNHPAPDAPQAILFFDDQKSFAAEAVADGAFHGASETVPVIVTTAPPSGFAAPAGTVDLAAAARLAIGSCTSIAPDASSTFAPSPQVSTLVFMVPVATCVAANTDAPVDYSVSLFSLAGGTASAAGRMNVDEIAPVVGNLTIFYPAPAPALDWGHDGLHFTRLDSGNLFAFSAFDCDGTVAPSLDQQFPGLTVTSAPDTSGALSPACASGGVTVWRFTVSGDIASLPASLFAALDNALGFSGGVVDAAGNRTAFTASLGVTRKLWRATPAGAVSSLSVGASVFAAGSAGIFAFDRTSGAQTTWRAGNNGAAIIATNGGTAAALFPTPNAVGALFGPGSGGSCSHGDTVTSFGLIDPSTAAYTSESQVWDGTCQPGCIADTCGTATCANCSLCWNTFTESFSDWLTLSGSTVTCSPGPAPAAACAGSSDGPSSLTNRISTALPALRWLGQDGANAWALADASGTELGAYGAPLSTSPVWPIIDASSPPRAYLPDVFGISGRLDVVEVGAGGFGPTRIVLDGFPAFIADMQLSADGILYVLSGGAVHAIIVDSAGSGTGPGGPQAGAWPSQCHDPCRSSLVGYACPY
ncbi:MAG TPA: hypothetical protein VFL36_03140 [Myxococcales bacterium]|nr:hypothetical protein [Myxococcales bacterium]